MKVRRGLALAGALLVTACGLSVVGTSPEGTGLEAGVDGAPVSPDGAPLVTDDGAITADAGADAAIADAGEDVFIPEVDASGYPGPPVTVDGQGCPSGRGPAMLKEGKVCIDADEVTNAQYGVFLDALPTIGSPVDLSPDCKTKTSHTPGVWSGGLQQDLPVVNVDWCDADAFCRWAGKKLCGDTTGKPLPQDPGHLNKVGKDPWYELCSNDGANAYPYGDTYTVGKCNAGQGALAPAGNPYSCEGSLAGLHHMVGNAKELANTCAGKKCVARGGSFRDLAMTTCDTTSDVQRDTRADDMGIRCCAYLP